GIPSRAMPAATPVAASPRPVRMALSTSCTVLLANVRPTAIWIPRRHTSAVAPHTPDQSPVSSPRLIASYRSPNGWMTRLRMAVPISRTSPNSQLVSHSHASPTRLMVQSQAPESACLTCSMVAAQSVSRNHSQPEPRTLIVQSHASNNQSRRFRMVSVTAGACWSSQSQASPSRLHVQLHASPSQPASVSTVVANQGRCSSIHVHAPPAKVSVQAQADDSQPRTASILSAQLVSTSHDHALPTTSTSHVQPLVSQPLMSSTFSAQVVSVSQSQALPAMS